MGYMTDGLTLNTLREANKKRLEEASKNKKHKFHKSTKWTEAQWLQAVVGELGELANFRKKIERGDKDSKKYESDVTKEFADVLVYLDIFAMKCGVNLGKATIDKFNEVSDRVNSEVYINDDGSDWRYEKVKSIDNQEVIK